MLDKGEVCMNLYEFMPMDQLQSYRVLPPFVLGAGWALWICLGRDFLWMMRTDAWASIFPLKCLKSNQKYGFSLKNPQNRLNWRKCSAPIQTVTHPPFTGGTSIMGHCELQVTDKSVAAGQRTVGAPFCVNMRFWILVNHREDLKVVVGVCLFIRLSNSHVTMPCAAKGARTLRNLRALKWRKVMGILYPTPVEYQPLRNHCAGVIAVCKKGLGYSKVKTDSGGNALKEALGAANDNTSDGESVCVPFMQRWFEWGIHRGANLATFCRGFLLLFSPKQCYKNCVWVEGFN